MNAIHAVWSEVRVPQLNRLLKNFGVRLIQTRSKKWGDKSTITGSYLEGGLPPAAKAAIDAEANIAMEHQRVDSERIADLEKSLARADDLLVGERGAMADFIYRIDALNDAINNWPVVLPDEIGKRLSAIMEIANAMRPSKATEPDAVALELN